MTAPLAALLAGNAERHATLSSCLSLRLTGAGGSWLAVRPLSW